MNYVEGAPSETEVAYEVDAYVSVVDGDGIPIENLTVENFAMIEDAQQVQLRAVEMAQDRTLQVVLILDTSTSMVGQPMTAARQAAGAFVEGLNDGDSVALVSFNHIVTAEMDFTTDHQAVQERLSTVNAVPSAGACLYDAVWQAVQMTASLPSGRRAVVLLTDGPDEYNGQPCSAVTADDVVAAASGGGTRVPIYTIGLGMRVDTPGLTRLAALTGGRYLNSPSMAQLEPTFLRVLDQLHTQYVLRYLSYAAPGAHTLVVEVESEGARDQDTREFLLPPMPTRVSFRTPLEGEEVSGLQTVAVAVGGGGEPVMQVVLQVNGEPVASDASIPYEMEVDFDPYGAGELVLTAVVQGAGEVELARATVTVTHVVAPAETEVNDEGGLSKQTLMVGGIVLGVLVLAGLAFLLMSGGKKKKQERARAALWEQAKTLEEAATAPAAAERTMDDWTAVSGRLGLLTVEASDDPAMIGQRFDITRLPVTLGRSADNDFAFPKDSPVSRRHAEIIERGGTLYLREVQAPDESGQMRGPKFGTFVDDVQISQPVALRSGAVICLGKRVALRFEAPLAPVGSPEQTRDDFERGAADNRPSVKNDPDATRNEQ
ncbi:MAG: VWA domain-containing protein [Anaerolineales bacterium]